MTEIYEIDFYERESWAMRPVEIEDSVRNLLHKKYPPTKEKLKELMPHSKPRKYRVYLAVQEVEDE